MENMSFLEELDLDFDQFNVNQEMKEEDNTNQQAAFFIEEAEDDFSCQIDPTTPSTPSTPTSPSDIPTKEVSSGPQLFMEQRLAPKNNIIKFFDGP